MPVIPVNPNHPAASAARKRTPSAAVCESPPRAAKNRVNNVPMHGASTSAPRIATDADYGAGLANAHAVSVAALKNRIQPIFFGPWQTYQTTVPSPH